MKLVACLTRTLLLAATVLVPTLAAQQVIGTKSGQSLSGTLLTDDGKSITFRTVDGLEMTVPYGDLDAQTIYRLMATKTADTDGPGQMRLGDQAAAADLFDAARRAYSRALVDSPSLLKEVDAKLASLRIAASNSLLAEAKRAAEYGRPDVALHDLALLMHEFPGEPATQEGSAMLATLSASTAAARSKAQAAVQSQEIQQALAPMEATYATMGTKITQGLQNTGSSTDSIDDFKSAAEMGHHARLMLKELQGQASSIKGLGPAIQTLDNELVDRIVNAYTQAANAYNGRSSYNDANTEVDLALALQPENQSLLQLRAQIASNASGGGVEGVSGFAGWRPIARPYR